MIRLPVMFSACCIASLTACHAQAPVSVAVRCPNPAKTAAAPRKTASELANDRLCKKLYAVPCAALPHLLGPITAEQLAEPRACINETIMKREAGGWIPALATVRSTGEKIPDFCVPISL